MDRAGRVEETRNQITHSIWAAGETIDERTRIKTTAKEKHGLRFSFNTVTVADLQVIAAEIGQLAGDIQAFDIRLVFAGKTFNNPPGKLW